MAFPFSRQQFFELFSHYNVAVWPVPLLAIGVALLCLLATLGKSSHQRWVGWGLGLLWAWMAIGYHWAFFTRINPAAWLFGAGYLVAAALFVKNIAFGSVRFELRVNSISIVALLLVAYALIGYPLVGTFAGHRYPHVPTFGLPCPTTIFTLGLLLLAHRSLPLSLLVVPVAWSLIGTVAALRFGVVQDYGLFVAGCIAAGVFAGRGNRLVPRGDRSHVRAPDS